MTKSMLTTASAIPRVLCCSFAALLCLPSAGAKAHDAPVASAVVRDAEQRIALFVTNRGLVVSDPATGGYRLLCNEALGLSTSPAAGVAVVTPADWVAGTASGLQRTVDSGCNWEPASSLAATPISALASEPTRPAQLWAASRTAEASAIHNSVDGGHTFTTMHRMDGQWLVEAILVSPKDGQHILASGTHFTAEAVTAFLMRSQDGGQTWNSRALSELDEPDQPFIEAVHPFDSEVLVLRVIPGGAGLQPSQLWLSRDGGDSLEEIFAAQGISHARFDGEGRLWVATLEGLYVQDETRETFSRVTAAERLSCLDLTDDKVLTCGHYGGLGAAGVGVSAIAAVPNRVESLSKLFDFADVDTPAACAEDSRTSTICEKPWNDWAVELLGASPTAPAAAAGDGAAAQPAPSPVSSNGDCTLSASARTTGRTKPSLLAWATLLGGLLWRSRRRSHF